MKSDDILWVQVWGKGRTQICGRGKAGWMSRAGVRTANMGKVEVGRPQEQISKDAWMHIKEIL